MPTIPYFNADGKRVPSVTTVLKTLGWNREPLIWWANKEGLAGRDLNQARQAAADVGTIAHAMAEAHAKGEDQPDMSDLDPKMVEKARGIFERWGEWYEDNVVSPILVEPNLVSEVMQVGGTPDMLFEGKRGIYLYDLKAGGVYAEALVQVAAYAMIVEEVTPHPINRLAILRLPKDSGGMIPVVRPWSPESDEAQVFVLARAIYDIHARLKREV